MQARSFPASIAVAAAALILLASSSCAKKDSAKKSAAEPSSSPVMMAAPSSSPEAAKPESDASLNEGAATKPAAKAVSAAGSDSAASAPAPAKGKAVAPTGKVSVTAIGPFDLSTLKTPPIDSFDAYLAWMKANSKDSEKYLRLRWERMAVDNRIHPENTVALRKAFLMTPREEFARSYNAAHVYDHAAWPIEDGQTISGPHLVTRMTHNLELKPGMKVLEIGMGSGYQSALLSFMTDQVYTIEIKSHLFEVSDAIYKRLEADYPSLRNVKRMNADGYYGWEQYAPFDRIIVTCGIDHIPPALLKQLKPDGIMVIPIGPMNGEQVIFKITKRVEADGTITTAREDIYGGKVVQAFVPFTASDNSWHQNGK